MSPGSDNYYEDKDEENYDDDPPPPPPLLRRTYKAWCTICNNQCTTCILDLHSIQSRVGICNMCHNLISKNLVVY